MRDSAQECAVRSGLASRRGWGRGSYPTSWRGFLFRRMLETGKPIGPSPRQARPETSSSSTTSVTPRARSATATARPTSSRPRTRPRSTIHPVETSVTSMRRAPSTRSFQRLSSTRLSRALLRLPPNTSATSLRPGRVSRKPDASAPSPTSAASPMRNPSPLRRSPSAHRSPGLPVPTHRPRSAPLRSNAG